MSVEVQNLPETRAERERVLEEMRREMSTRAAAEQLKRVAELSNLDVTNPVQMATLAASLPPPPLMPHAAKNFCNVCMKELCNKYFLTVHMKKMHNIIIEDEPGRRRRRGGGKKRRKTENAFAAQSHSMSAALDGSSSSAPHVSAATGSRSESLFSGFHSEAAAEANFSKNDDDDYYDDDDDVDEEDELENEGHNRANNVRSLAHGSSVTKCNSVVVSAIEAAHTSDAALNMFDLRVISGFEQKSIISNCPSVALRQAVPLADGPPLSFGNSTDAVLTTGPKPLSVVIATNEQNFANAATATEKTTVTNQELSMMSSFLHGQNVFDKANLSRPIFTGSVQERSNDYHNAHTTAAPVSARELQVTLKDEKDSSASTKLWLENIQSHTAEAKTEIIHAPSGHDSPTTNDFGQESSCLSKQYVICEPVKPSEKADPSPTAASPSSGTSDFSSHSDSKTTKTQEFLVKLLPSDDSTDRLVAGWIHASDENGGQELLSHLLPAISSLTSKSSLFEYEGRSQMQFAVRLPVRATFAHPVLGSLLLVPVSSELN